MTALVVRVGPASLRTTPRSWWVGAALMVAILAVGAVLLSTGDYPVPLARVWDVLTGGGSGADLYAVRTLRLPRLLTGLLVGAALGASGALFQSLTRNPLGSPDLIGFSTGSATGALVVILVWHGGVGQTAVGAVAGGLVTAAAVTVLASRHGLAGLRLVLVGLGTAALLESANSYLITRASLGDAQTAAVWLLGSLNERGWEHVRPVALALVVLLPLALWAGRGLGVLELGDDAAQALGIRAGRVRLAAVVVGVGLTAVATAAAGPVSFVALAAPQVARRLTAVSGPNVVPAALTGALLLAAADLAAQRVFAPTILPVGVATGAVGGLYLAWLLSREWRRG